MKKKTLQAIAFALLLLIPAMHLSAQDGEKLTITEDEKKIFESVDEDGDNPETSDESKYDIIIIDIGFNRWLNQIAKPKGYYSQSFMENRNYIYVLEWNRRVLTPRQFSPQLYELQIDYDPNIDYGYDVNFQLYNYFIYFQRKYDQRLGPFLPRI